MEANQKYPSLGPSVFFRRQSKKIMDLENVIIILVFLDFGPQCNAEKVEVIPTAMRIKPATIFLIHIWESHVKRKTRIGYFYNKYIISNKFDIMILN